MRFIQGYHQTALFTEADTDGAPLFTQPAPTPALTPATLGPWIEAHAAERVMPDTICYHWATEGQLYMALATLKKDDVPYNVEQKTATSYMIAVADTHSTKLARILANIK